MKNHFITRTIVGVSCFAIIAASGLFASPAAVHAAISVPVQSASSASQKADRIVSLAQSLQGKVHYKYGVNDPSRYYFDCSAFTKYVFASQGINLKWGSRSQSQQGTYVSKSALKKGDLLFFSVGTPGKIGHVGIYMGNGKFIHNTIGSSVNGVVISDLSKYSNRYITARRVIN